MDDTMERNRKVYCLSSLAADEYISEELRHAPGHIQSRGLAGDNVSFSFIFLILDYYCCIAISLFSFIYV